ncbi:MAG: acyltransferase [Acidobacteria bacterium]|nr:acyltransferase [Acidobacteriota bacterium]
MCDQSNTQVASVSVIGTAVAELGDWRDALLAAVPGRTGYHLRAWHLKGRLGRCDGRVLCDRDVTIVGHANVQCLGDVSLSSGTRIFAATGTCVIGRQVSVGVHVMLDASDSGTLVIGDGVLIAANCVVRTSNHVFSRRDVPIRQQGHRGGSVVIGDDVWLGAGVVVLPDVEIGTGTVVAAEAVVSRSLPPCSIAAGVPARVIKARPEGRPE